MLVFKLRWEQYAPGPVRVIAVATLAEANRIAEIAAKNKKRKRDLLALAAAAGPDPAPEGPADVVIADAAPGPRAFGCGRCRMNPNGCSNCKRAGYTPRGKAKAKAKAKAAGAPQDPNHGGRGRGRGAAGAGGFLSVLVFIVFSLFQQ